jgi:peptidoglycan/xylan/chitin deacetylase (PgdA/CDA1 family)
MKCLQIVLSIYLSVLALTSQAASVVIYHHVSENTPASTSVSPEQFEQHLELIEELGLKVVPITQITDAIKNNEPVSNNWIAITFDDGYRSVYEYALEKLKARKLPFTIFVNPDMVKPSKMYMSWPELKEAAQHGAIIANHTLKHENLVSDGLTKEQIKQNLLDGEQKILDETGQSHRLLAYPYGEYNDTVRQALGELGFVGFAQHSGAIGNSSDLLALSRFPANGIYANPKTLRNKINSLPFDIDAASPTNTQDSSRTPKWSVSLKSKDFYQSQLACFISGLDGAHKPTWLDELNFEIKAPEAIGDGRVKYNCPAPSIKNSGRFYWMSKLWIN